MGSYNNYYGDTVDSLLGERVSGLIMDITMSDNYHGKYRTVFYYDTKENITHRAHYGK